jgi:hypothetical protein
MRLARIFAAALLILPFGTFSGVVRADEISIDEDSYAAVAYSPSTGDFRYAYGYGDRDDAEQAALEGFHAKDARIVCWVNNGFCALALGDDKSAWGVGYEYGDAASNTEAMGTAMEECRKRTKGAHIVLCLSSDGQYIYKPQRPATGKSSGANGERPTPVAPPPPPPPPPSENKESAAPIGSVSQ